MKSIITILLTVEVAPEKKGELEILKNEYFSILGKYPLIQTANYTNKWAVNHPERYSVYAEVMRLKGRYRYEVKKYGDNCSVYYINSLVDHMVDTYGDFEDLKEIEEKILRLIGYMDVED